MVNEGMRIYKNIKRPNKELVEGFKGLPTPNIADNMNGFFCVNSEIKGFNDCKLLGTAFTVKSRTADILFFHKALDMAQPGDVIVVDVQGNKTWALCGEIMARYAKKRGIAGFLIDGLVRDTGALKELDFAVFAKGASPMGPYKDGPGEINVPVSCGGVIINPGDIIVGDEDGVVVIKAEEAEEVLKKAKATFVKEDKTFKSIEGGTMDRSWVDAKLKEKGVEIID